MQIDNIFTGKRASCFRPALLGLGGFRFRSVGFSKLTWTAFCAVLSFAASAWSEQAKAGGGNPDMAEFAARVSELVGQVAAAGPATVAPKVIARRQGATLPTPNADADGDIQVHRRAGDQTVMRFRPARSASAPKRIALPNLAGSHERTAREFLSDHRTLLRLADPDNELDLVRNERDALGYQHLRFKQQYRGLAVWPAELNVHFDPDGNVDLLEGAYAPTPELNSITPA
jgi:hypothetical protein